MAQNQEDREPKEPVKPPRGRPPRDEREEDYDEAPIEPRVRGGDRSRLDRDRYYDRRPEKKEGGSLARIGMTAVVAAVVVLVMGFIGISGGVKASDVNKTLDGVATDIRGLKDADTAIKASVTTLNNQVSGMTSTNAANAQSVAAQNTKIDSAVSQATSANSQISNLTSQIATANANIAKLQSVPSVNPDLQKQVDSDKATIVKLQSQIDDINKKITASSSTIGTATGTGTIIGGTATGITSNTLQGVTATISNLYGGFNGVPLMSFSVPQPTGGTPSAISISYSGSGYSVNASILVNISGSGGTGATGTAVTDANGHIISCYNITGGTGYSSVAPNNQVAIYPNTGSYQALATGIVTSASAPNGGVASQMITMTVTNANTVIVNNVQLALGLVMVDANGNQVQTLPGWMTLGQNVAVTSGGFGSSWTLLSTIAPSTWVFTNITGTNNMFGLGAISLQPGATQTLSQYIQISNSSGAQYGGSTVYIAPMIKVLSFTP